MISRRAAYLATQYQIDGGGEARIGRRAPSLEDCLGRRPGVFVTAWNPGSLRYPRGWNDRRLRALLERLRRWPFWLGWGVGRGWCERHVLIAADPRLSIRLARIFRQAAVVVLSRASARLVWVPRHRLTGRAAAAYKPRLSSRRLPESRVALRAAAAAAGGPLRNRSSS